MKCPQLSGLFYVCGKGQQQHAHPSQASSQNMHSGHIKGATNSLFVNYREVISS
jgi:hypothetical protein